MVKSQVIPRILQILDPPNKPNGTPGVQAGMDVKLKVFETLKIVMKAIDAQTLKNDVMKCLERVRIKETDPRVCLKMLEIYEEIAKVLGPEEVGMKILPSIIPMLISGQFTKSEF